MLGRRWKTYIVQVIALSTPGLAGTAHFKQWFPQYGAILQQTVHASCSSEYKYYLQGDAPYCSNYYYVGCLTGHMVDCILSNSVESLKANMASAAVLLGVLPTTLGLVGSSTVEAGLLALRRPFLAFLLVAGSPAVSPIRTFEYRSPVELLRKEPDCISTHPKGGLSQSGVVVLQYLAAAGAVVNLAHVSWQLSIWTVCAFSSDSEFLPLLWAFLAIVVHLFGTLAVMLRVRLSSRSGDTISTTKDQVKRAICREFKISCDQEPSKLEFRKESRLFIFISWFTSTGTVLHIIFGTVVFSSMLFISTQDALIVVGRYLASALICRIVLMFEVSGMRGVIKVHHLKLNDGYQDVRS